MARKKQVGGEVGRPGWLPFDLLGQPVPPNKGMRGRNEHVATAENLGLAVQLYAERYGDEEVAAALGISAPTLRKHYFRHPELKKVRGRARMLVTGKLVAKLHELAEAGKIGAIEKLMKRLDKADQVALAERIKDRGKSEAKAAPLGKKEQAALTAREVRGRFAPEPTPPRLIN